MNGDHHEDLTLVACHLARIPEEHREALIRGAGHADYLEDVACPVPFHDSFPGTWSALCHFQRPDGSGYRWADDRSLGALEELGNVALHLSGAHVSGTSEPMRAACLIQQGRVLSEFRFPSAARMASLGGGVALHLVQDTCCPHHGWNMLLWGHQEFEDALEVAWNKERFKGKVSSDPRAFGAMLRKLVDAENITAHTVGDICRDNAAWSAYYFGKPHRLEECSWDLALPICARAIASTMRAIEIMKGTHAS